MKKLLLAYPNQRWQKDDMNTVWDLSPSTLCLLAATVKDAAEVRIADAHFYDMSRQELAQKISEYMPDYVGVSVMTSEYRDILDIAARIAKQINPEIKVIAGGVHVTTNYDYVMKNPDIDYCVRGEGEYALRDLIRYLNNEGPFPERGIVYRQAGKVIAQEAAFVPDLSRLPRPDYGLVDFKAYLTRSSRLGPNSPPELPYVNITTTRGCPFGCSFCQVEVISGKSVRARDPEDVVDELLFLKERYGIRSVIFSDDNLLMAPHSYARRLFTCMIEKKLGLKWLGSAFALFLLTDELLDLIRDSGCVGINVAIESGNPRVLKELVGKPIKDLDKVPQIIGKIRSRGMFCIANFIIGFPGETWAEIRQTIAFAEKCGADYVKFFVAVALYGTKLHKLAIEKGVLQCEEGLYPKIDWRYSRISSDEWTAKDVSILRAYEWDRINFSKEKIKRTAQIWGVTEEELNKIRKKTRDALVF